MSQQNYSYLEVNTIIFNCLCKKDRKGISYMADIIIEDAHLYNDSEMDAMVYLIEKSVKTLNK